MTKKCPRCCLVLTENEFNWKIKDKLLAAYCKPCSRKYVREHYSKNVQYYIQKAGKRRKEYKLKLFEYVGSFLKTHPCVDCGENDILVLEFDHKDRSKKSDNISKIMKRMLSMKRLISEIDKCDVRCANCHRRKTEKENNSWKLNFAPVV